MQRLNCVVCVGLLALLVTPTSVTLANLDNATLQMCDRIKVCTLESIDETTMDDSMRTMLFTLIDGLCADFAAPYAVVVGEKGLEQAAIQCIDAALELDCTQLMNRSAENLPQCQAFRQAVNSTP